MGIDKHNFSHQRAVTSLKYFKEEEKGQTQPLKCYPWGSEAKVKST
jgi:hypothetical protein